MTPDDALQRSDLRVIRADIHDGVAIIHQSPATTGAFHARIVRRDQTGQLRMAAMKVIGDFESLAEALSALRETFGVDITEWQPDAGVDLRLNDNGGMQPTGT